MKQAEAAAGAPKIRLSGSLRAWKRYPEYKDSGVEWLGEVPRHWAVKRLKFELLGIEQGWSPQCEARLAAPDEWGVLKVGCVNEASFNPEEHKALPSSETPLTQYEIRTGDVLMSRANTTELLGSAALVGEVRPRLLLCDKLYRLKIKSQEVHSSFLTHLLRSSVCRFQFERDATGASSSMQNIGLATIRESYIPFPNFQEQQRIAEWIDTETAKLDALITKKERLLELLAEKRSALSSNVVIKGLDPNVPMKDSSIEWLGDIPVHWRPKKIKYLFHQTKRQNYPTQTVLSVYRDYGVIEKSSRDDKDRSINKCRMIREGAIIPFGQQGVKDDFQVVLHVGCRIAARFIQTPHHVHRRS